LCVHCCRVLVLFSIFVAFLFVVVAVVYCADYIRLFCCCFVVGVVVVGSYGVVILVYDKKKCPVFLTLRLRC